jgi:hypothetical protein
MGGRKNRTDDYASNLKIPVLEVGEFAVVDSGQIRTSA